MSNDVAKGQNQWNNKWFNCEYILMVAQVACADGLDVQFEGKIMTLRFLA